MNQTQKKSVLSSSLVLGPVELNVHALETMREYYVDLLGLKVISSDLNKVVLGRAENPLIVLHAQPALKQAHRFHAGLFHFALLFHSRNELAKTVDRVLKKAGHTFSGSADHLVSEAFYFSDPEGNGIELYFDRDATTWQWKDNQVQMATIYIDPLQYIEKHLDLNSEDDQTVMGHVHLKVGDIAQAKAFYVDVLGFDITAQLPGALFISVGGYHHHLGLNTWESLGATERPESLGLKSIEIQLPAAQDLLSLQERLTQHQVSFQELDKQIIFHDPWKNTVNAHL